MYSKIFGKERSYRNKAIFVQELRSTRENLSGCPSQDSNRASVSYKYRVIQLDQAVGLFVIPLEKYTVSQLRGPQFVDTSKLRIPL
jgi:hypothetical protein